MKNDDYCSGCGQKETCRQAYEKIGKAKGPNVAWKVIVAFLVPIGVFVGTVAVAERLLEGQLEGKVVMLVSFLLALGVTLLAIFVIRAFSGLKKKEYSDKR